MQIEELKILRTEYKKRDRLKVEEAINQQNRIRFHTTIKDFKHFGFDLDSIDFNNFDSSFISNNINNDFFNWVKGLLPSSKYIRFLQLFKPITAEIIEEAFLKLERVTEAQDRVVDVYLNNEQKQLAFDDFRNTILKDNDFIKKEIFDDILKNQHNSICAIDINELGQPYPFVIQLEQVHSLKNKVNGDFIFIEFGSKEENESYLYCNEYYRKVRTDGSDIAEVLEEFKHELGYCPAHYVYNKNYAEYDNSIVKKYPFSNHLGTLDSMLFQNVGIEYQKLYNFPIIEKPATKCNYKNNDNSCQNGYIHTTTEAGNTTKKRCPNCEREDFLAGAGTVINKVVVKSEEDVIQYLSNAVSFVAPPIANLEYSEQNLEYRKRDLIYKITGFADNENNSQAKNELQISSYYEGQLTVLEKFKQPIEQLHKFILKTCAKLMYPANFNFCIVDYGQKFYLRTEKEILDEYEKAKTANAPTIVLEGIMSDYVAQRYRNKPELLQKVEFEKRLNKWSKHSVVELNSFLQQNLLSLEAFELTINFSYYLDLFEQYNGSIVSFENKKTIIERVNLIRTKLLEYVKQELQSVGNPQAGRTESSSENDRSEDGSE